MGLGSRYIVSEGVEFGYHFSEFLREHGKYLYKFPPHCDPWQAFVFTILPTVNLHSEKDGFFRISPRPTEF